MYRFYIEVYTLGKLVAVYKIATLSHNTQAIQIRKPLHTHLNLNYCPLNHAVPIPVIVFITYINSLRRRTAFFNYCRAVYKDIYIFCICSTSLYIAVKVKPVVAMHAIN